MNLNKEEWKKEDYQEYIEYLKSIKEEEYAKFQQKFIDTKYSMLGIRVPMQRKIAKEIAKGNVLSFFKWCKDDFYEEVNIEGFVIALLQDKKEFDTYFKKFLPKIDNWATCDCFCKNIFVISHHKESYFATIKKLFTKKEVFTVRVGLVLLLSYYVEESYVEEILELVNQIPSQEYYIQMAIAWLLCELYIHYPKKVLPFLQTNQLNAFTQNKTIQKICDSYRISKNCKEQLKRYRK